MLSFFIYINGFLYQQSEKIVGIFIYLLVLFFDYMKKLIYLVVGTIVLAASNVIMYNVGKKECEYCNAVFEGLHKFYDTDSILWNKFMQTEEYQKIDSLNQGDWEDFYLYHTKKTY